MSINQAQLKKLDKIPIFNVDAFTNQIFSGNPAAGCLLVEWISDKILLSIAAENNLSKTAFINILSSPFLFDGLLLKSKLIFADTLHLPLHGSCLASFYRMKPIR